MCVKFSLGDLNPGPYPPHLTCTYTCGVIIAPKICGGECFYFSLDLRVF